jgi:hypothetical protein
MRIPCTVRFKLNIKNHMKELGNTAAVRYSELAPTNKNDYVSEEGKRKKLLDFKKLNSLFIYIEQNGLT